ncbi:ABC transporter substrate-binding protein [Nonomuraea sp. NPDC005650]|uniref:ABC transporter substrate-binding protein n=1 Tax=Nonomuraea sp. NPDC005650 TaxID=3157045 RepID=UPI0033B1B8E9
MFGKHARAGAAAALAVFALAACGGANVSNRPSSGAGPTGRPVTGGVGRVIESAEPRSLDPALLANSWANSTTVGNALYGQLMINDPQTQKIEYRIAESFSTDDGGKTHTLTLRKGVLFSDGTPLTAEAVAFSWERIKDPKLSSPDLPQASLIRSTKIVDDSTLVVTLTEPVPNFAFAIVTTSLNWIGKPDVLKQGRQAVDSQPIGAGPFVLEKWARQDRIVMVRNKRYWDAPRPYLDRLEVRGMPDKAQRYNNTTSGAADVVVEGDSDNLKKASQSGRQTGVVPLGGGIALVLNNSKPPFDDPRARKALSMAIDPQGINDAIYNGTAQVPATLFPEGSPFYRNIPLQQRNPAEAQKLFDQLAAAGKALSFTYTAISPATRQLGETLQTQLSTFKNVKVGVEVLDPSESGVRTVTGDFEAISSSVIFGDPEPRLWFGVHSESRGNFSRVKDSAMSVALEKGRTAQSAQERAAAYEIVQRRLVELTPVIFYARAEPGFMANANVGGVKQYGLGSLLPDQLWIQAK